MKPQTAFLAILLFTTTSYAAEVKLVFSISDSNGQKFGANVVFEGEKALEYGEAIQGPPDATFDLIQNAWSEANGVRITRDQVIEWAESTKQRSLASLTKVEDPDYRAFVEWLINPAFALSEEGGVLQWDSRFLTYTASGPLVMDASMKRALFAYDELNAYRKAMVLRKAPPFPHLFVSRALKDRNMFPGTLVMNLRTPNGEVKVVTTISLVALTSLERAEIEKHLSANPRPSSSN